ncbi:MAG: hypothetical protein J4N81_16265, partial [Chloroflexi bacterium]|nr:hypothetical protein [Chloroflexota bacterium]
VDHPPETGLGRREYIGRGWKLSNAKVAIQKAAPMLGEANDYVLGQVLGLDTQAIRRLEQDGVIGQAPSGAASPTVVPLDRQVELGWIVEHDA